MRGGEYGRAAWEAMALYTASCENERAPETTLRQFAVAACGSQAAIATACTARKGRLTADRARRRLRAAQLVTLALLAAIGSTALAVLFAGSITAAAAACRRALMLCAAGTPVINKTAALRKVIPYAWMQVKANPIFWSGSGLMRVERTGLTQMQARQTLIIGSGLKYGLSRKVRRYMHGKRTVL